MANRIRRARAENSGTPAHTENKKRNYRVERNGSGGGARLLLSERLARGEAAARRGRGERRGAAAYIGSNSTI